MRLLKFIMQWIHSPVIVAEKSKVWRFLRIDNMRRVRKISDTHYCVHTLTSGVMIKLLSNLLQKIRIEDGQPHPIPRSVDF